MQVSVLQRAGTCDGQEAMKQFTVAGRPRELASIDVGLPPGTKGSIASVGHRCALDLASAANA